MISKISSSLPDRSRLVRLLAQAASAKVSVSEVNLAQEMARLIGLSDSLDLAYSLGQLPNSAVGLSVDSAADIKRDVLSSRKQMIKVITRSFSDDTEGARVNVPSAWQHIGLDALQTFEPYERFYTLHQVEMASAVQRLRLRVRRGLTGFSTNLNRLAELDKILDESLDLQARAPFKVAPRLLQRRFDELLMAHQTGAESKQPDDLTAWVGNGGWLEQLYQEIRELLLAELDMRLQPVLGMLEALNEHIEKKV